MAVSTNLEALTLANHDFSFSLYKELAKTNTGNLFYSPFSIHVIMFMASVGAASKTFDEMIATMHLNKTTHSLDEYKTLLDKLTSDNNHLKLATGIDTHFNVKESFMEKSRKYLKSSVEKLNFHNDSNKQRNFINNWVLNNTNNKISNLFPEGTIKTDTALVLANAIHFKSNWENEFYHVKDEPFYLTLKNKVIVKMMTMREHLQYYHDKSLKFSALELPYEKRNFKMIILLPDDKDGLKNLENNLSKIKLHEISKKMSEHDVTVKLPRFKIEQSLQLEETLKNLGCPTMFTQAANFTNISAGGNLYVSKVVHKAYVNVNEQGTEAAAATGMGISLTSLPPPRPEANFFADHSFIFSIISRNGHVLFIGRLLNM